MIGTRSSFMKVGIPLAAVWRMMLSTHSGLDSLLPFYDAVRENKLQCIRQNRCVYYNIQDLNRLFKNKKPMIPTEIRRNYIRGCQALKKYHIGQKRFSEMTKAAGVTKVRTEGNFVWYKKSELDTLFFMINA